MKRDIDPMIAIERLNKIYSGKNVISNLELNVARGELFGFLGPNGAGKTTTIRILTTLTKPTSGRILINGIDMVRDPLLAKSQFGVVQQHMSLNRDLTVRENLEFHARLHHMPFNLRNDRIDEILGYVELTDFQSELIDKLSGGLVRRTLIARALLHRPVLLFLDEPTVGLDARARRRVWDLIRRMNKDGSTVFLTTHYIEEAESLCNRVGIIHQGRIIALDSPLHLRQHLGLICVEIHDDLSNGTNYRFFQDRMEAAIFMQNLRSSGSVIMRESNLEDVFVEITGRKVMDSDS